ncbi:GTPase [Stratiformator vulcanicus]|uniref:tRNA modification GTPase MnmE n=1 Tax=Stratiformator vulcanicus TaxID=2527980 RepID=A0A517R6Z0_9PLAN|nr:GTPase [Stratiformator vulcanicus]QDT39635.1 tRNA modification GTPase MnmE [Stratiformator vulcanicus]
MNSSDIACRIEVLTAAGRGAIGTLRFVGPVDLIDAAECFRAANGRSIADQMTNRIFFGHWGRGEATEEVVLCRTSADELEIHCHGGSAAITRILNDVRAAGATVARESTSPEDQSHGLSDKFAQVVTGALTARTALLALGQFNGAFNVWLDRIEEIDSDFQLRSEVEAVISRGDVGIHLTAPWQVVLYGQPNVGKSSLINALLGYGRAIVSSTAGTTRDVVSAETALDGWPIRLSDTAGLRDSSDDIEQAGIGRALEQIETSDCRILVIDGSRPLTPAERELCEQSRPNIVVRNKSDLSTVAVLPANFEGVVVSATTGRGIDELAELIVDELVPDPPTPELPIPVTHRQIELLREAADLAAHGQQTAALEVLQQMRTGQDEWPTRE